MPVIENYFFTPALKGPTGIQVASERVMSGYVVWNLYGARRRPRSSSSRSSTPRALHVASKFCDFPSFYGAAADPRHAAGQKPERRDIDEQKQCNNNHSARTPPDKTRAAGQGPAVV